MKKLWVLGAFLFFIGLGFIFSGLGLIFFSNMPETVQEPYVKTVTETKNNLLQDGTLSAMYTFFSKSNFFKNGDKISITASIEEGTLSISVFSLTSGTIASKVNVESGTLDVTIPSDGYYEINVKRYRANEFVLFFTKVDANVKVTAQTTEQSFVTAYRPVTVYPNKGLENYGLILIFAGLILLLAGVGAEVLSFINNKGSSVLAPPPPPPNSSLIVVFRKSCGVVLLAEGLYQCLKFKSSLVYTPINLLGF